MFWLEWFLKSSGLLNAALSQVHWSSKDPQWVIDASVWHESCSQSVKLGGFDRSFLQHSLFDTLTLRCLNHWSHVCFLLQEDASNTTILGLLLECSLPKSLFNNPQVLLFPSLTTRLSTSDWEVVGLRPDQVRAKYWTWSEAPYRLTQMGWINRADSASFCKWQWLKLQLEMCLI